MRPARIVALSALALGTSLVASAAAAPRWSGTAQAGFVLAQDSGLGAGGWLGLSHVVAPSWSVGGELGYTALPGHGSVCAAEVGLDCPTGRDFRLASLAAVVTRRAARRPGAHLVGTLGLYDVVERAHFARRPDSITHDWRPGLSLGIGVSGPGPVSPEFDLRWERVVGAAPEAATNAASFRFGVRVF